MKKTALITLYGDFNLGNKLQNYACVRLLQSNGTQCNTIFFRWNVSGAAGLKGTRTVIIKDYIKRMLLHLGIRTKRIRKFEVIYKRRRIFESFSRKYLHLAEEIKFIKIPKNLPERYDYFCAGSDQVWHNWSGTQAEMDYFFLKFASKKQRICLSPSFGREEIQEDQKEIYRNGLNGFEYLSCREESGVRLIHELTGRKAELLVDPTMAVARVEWEKIAQKPDYAVPPCYILLYLLGDEIPETLETVKSYAEFLNAKIINIYDMKGSPEYYLTGPCEFLYLIQNALLVCTNSFHGSVFSILFHKNFVCFPRKDHNMDSDMSNRITTLLEKFHLEHRQSYKATKDNLLQTDFSEVDEQLAVERKRMIHYLQKALKGGERS